MSAQIDKQIENLMTPTTEQGDEYCEEFTENGKKSFRCTFADCNKVFRYKSQFTRHLDVHINKKPLICPYEGCKKEFKRGDALKNHMNIHTNRLPFECNFPDCGEKFPTQAHLRYHRLKHEDQKAFKCSFPGCDKTFLTLQQLKQHENTLNCHSKRGNPNVKEEAKDAEKPRKQVKSSAVSEAGGSRESDKKAAEQPAVDGSKYIDEGVQNSFSDMIKCIVQENNTKKGKLEMSMKFMDLFQENHELKAYLSRRAAIQRGEQPELINLLSGGDLSSFDLSSLGNYQHMNMNLK